MKWFFKLKYFIVILLLNSITPLATNLATTPTTAIPANEEISFDAEVDKRKINIADSLKLTLTLKSPKEKNLFLPTFDSKRIGEFTIENVETEIFLEEDKSVQRNTYDLTIYQTGEFDLPPFIFKFANSPSGGKTELTTDPILIQVESLLSGDDELSSNSFLFPVERKVSFYFYLLVVAIFLILLALTYFIFKRKTKQKKFYELAALQLKKLLKKYNLPLSIKKIKNFYFEKSKIVKFFLAGKYQKKELLGYTSRQTIAFLKKNNNGELDFYQLFFNYSDEVKFSKKKNDEIKDVYLVKTFENIINGEKLKHTKKNNRINDKGLET